MTLKFFINIVIFMHIFRAFCSILIQHKSKEISDKRSRNFFFDRLRINHSRKVDFLQSTLFLDHQLVATHVFFHFLSYPQNFP